MKKVFCIFAIMLFSLGCDNNSEGIDPDLLPDLQTEIKENVVVISENAETISTAEEISNGILIIEPATAAEDVEIGDVLIGQEDGGYLAKVISKAIDGNQVRFEIEQATLEDVFVNAEFSFSADLSETADRNGEGDANRGGGEGFSYDFSNTVIYQDGPVVFKITDGSATFNPNFDFDFDFEDGELQSFEFKAENAQLTIDCDLFLGLSAEGNLADFSTTIAEFDKTFTTFVGFVPVVIIVSTELVAELSVNASAQMGFIGGFTSTNTTTLGASYNNGVWTNIGETNFSLVGKPVDNPAVAELTQNLTITPRVSIKLYNVVGPYCEPIMTEDLSLALSAADLDWNADVKAGLDIIVGAEAEILGVSLVSYEASLFSSEVTIWEAPSLVEIVSGNDQNGTQGGQLDEPLKVKVTDSFDNPLSNVPVYFEVAPNDGEVDNTSIMTDDEGFAEVIWTLGTLNTQQNVNVEIRSANGDAIGDALQFMASSEEAEIALIGDLNFGDVEIGNSEEKTFTIENGSDIEVTVSSIDAPNGYTVNWSGGQIGASSSQDVIVTFSPTAMEDYNGQITVNNSIDDINNVIGCLGTGVVGDALNLTGDLNFGDVVVNTSDIRVLSIQNNATVAMTVSSIDLPTGYSANWINGTVGAQGSQQVEITFAPTAVQAYNGTIVVNNSLDSDNNAIVVNGNGIEDNGELDLNGDWNTSYLTNQCSGPGTSSTYFNNRAILFESIDNTSGTVNIDSFLNPANNEQYAQNNYTFDGVNLSVNIQTTYITSGGDSITRTFTFSGTYDEVSEIFTGDFTYDWNNATDGSFDKNCEGTLELFR